MASVSDDVIDAYDIGFASIIVLLDYSKAFDTLDHRLLCAKLGYYGFDADAVGLVKSFPSNLHQKVGNKYSETIDIFSGVPRGRILSPLLFIVSHTVRQSYMRDISSTHIPKTYSWCNVWRILWF